MKKAFYTAASILCLGLWTCSNKSIGYNGGSGADVETKVIGSAVDSGGRPIAGAKVRLRPSDYVFPIANLASGAWGTSVDTFTDDKGAFRIDSVDSGSYVIEINNERGLSAAVRFMTPDSGAIADLGPHTLARICAIHGLIPAELRTGGQWFVQIYGLERIASVDYTSGTYSFSDIPAGAYSLRLMTTSSGVAPIVIDSLSAPSGGAVAAPTYPLWRYGRNLTLNTSSTGAEVSADVADFPVLIRLTSSNFDFAQAQPGGGDLRFTKSDGSPLPYEIEQWDAAAGRAAVWVKVDTVRGNNAAQYIVMQWGNPHAASQSSSTAVFDTAAGFAAVWHLGQVAGSIVPDATYNGVNGTATATAAVSGVVGMAQSFDGKSSVIQASGSNDSILNYPENGEYSVSAWVKVNTLDSTYYGIVYKSNFQYGLQIRPEKTWEFFTFIDKTGWEGSRCPATAGSWRFLTGVRRGARQYLFVDGVCVDSAKTVISSNLSRVSDVSLQIGHCPDGGLEPDRYFSGVIDEVRISKTAIGADWIKLCFMNQKEQDALVKW